ncbi:MAG: ClbS/DfsB family four-helix bundle protein [Saprospiraceae bacterium]|nr:ClbS/DfsB family four-helix bundle protein [Saprospiraceae bacterium]
MARPKSKTELISLSEKNHSKLFELIDHLPVKDQDAEFPPGTMNRNIRDVLGHLHHWHKMLLEWYSIGMSGKRPEMPAKGYSWKDTPLLNQWIWDHYKCTSLNEMKELFNNSHKKVMDIIHMHSNEELFTKKKYKWTGSTSLGAYLISSTSSHYDWAYKLIRKARKAM